MIPPLPPVWEDDVIVYSDWRDTPNLSGLTPEARQETREKYRRAADRGHAVRFSLHNKAIPDGSYTEIVSYKDPDTGAPQEGVRTVSGKHEELVCYPSRNETLSAYHSLPHAHS